MAETPKKTRRKSSIFKRRQSVGKNEIKIEIDTRNLHPKLSLVQTCVLLVSSSGGSGVFIAMTTIVVNTGSVGLTLISFIISGLLNYSLAMCFTEVAILLPKAGGPYFFILQVFGKFPAFLFIWGFMFLIITPVWALSALTSSLYIVQLFFPGCQPPDLATKLLAICILVLIVVLNCLYLKYVTKVQAFLTSAKVVAMLIIILGGAVALSQGETYNYENVFEGSTDKPGELSLSILAGMFIYGGWQIITFLLEEMESPEKSLPKAMGFSFFISIAFNVLTVAAYFVLISPKDMLNTDAVAILFMDRLYKPMSVVMSLFVTATSIGSLNAIVLGQSRLVYAAAKNHQMPSILATTSEKYRMPWAAIIMLCIISIIILLSGSFMVMIEMISFYAVIMSISVLLCLLTLRVTKPEANRPIKVWLVTALFQLVLNLVILLLSIYQKPQQMGQIILIIACGIPVYFICIKWKNKPSAFNRTLDTVTRVIQKTMLLKFS